MSSSIGSAIAPDVIFGGVVSTLILNGSDGSDIVPPTGVNL